MQRSGDIHDTTGNRRFLCFHINSMTFIDINYAQMYAQIKYLLSLPDYQYWFTQADNARIEENNKGFVFHSPEEEFKLKGTAKEALKQIDEKGYLIPYQANEREVIKIGVEFSAETRNLGRWLVE